MSNYFIISCKHASRHFSICCWSFWWRNGAKRALKDAVHSESLQVKHAPRHFFLYIIWHHICEEMARSVLLKMLYLKNVSTLPNISRKWQNIQSVGPRHPYNLFLTENKSYERHLIFWLFDFFSSGKGGVHQKFQKLQKANILKFFFKRHWDRPKEVCMPSFKSIGHSVGPLERSMTEWRRFRLFWPPMGNFVFLQH